MLSEADQLSAPRLTEIEQNRSITDHNSRSSRRLGSRLGRGPGRAARWPIGGL